MTEGSIGFCVKKKYIVKGNHKIRSVKMKEELFKVCIHTDQAIYGTLEYNPTTHAVSVHLSDAVKKAEIENYLSSRHTIQTAQHDLREFKKVDILPTENLESFKLALTRMWEATQVCVAWSRPV